MAHSQNNEEFKAQSAWLDRLLQLLHDPPGKVKYLPYHQKLSKDLAEAITALNWTEQEWKEGIVNRPDATAAGADRFCLKWSVRQHFNTVERQLVTHPMGRQEEGAAPLLLASSVGPPPVGKASGIEERQAQRESVKRLLSEELARDGNYEAIFYRVWRRWREELIARKGDDETEGVHRRLFWSAIPADTRCPDVSIWDHTRVTAGLSFMNVPSSTKRRPTVLAPEREPWLLQVSLGGVQTFIHTARTSRDLWVGSFLLADLSFHAMLPIIEQYGPTAVLYPDLWRNPRMDAWLKGTDRHESAETRQPWDALPSWAEPTSFAAVIPNSFVAVVPRGGGQGLPDLRDLAAASQKRVENRWGEYAKSVESFFDTVDGLDGHWKDIWKRRHQGRDIVCTRWTAVQWAHEPKMKKFVQSGVFPWQNRKNLQTEDPKDRGLRIAREARFTPWLSQDQWNQSERTRYAFGNINPNLLQMERGFDYAVTNAQLRAVHQLRKQAAVWPSPQSSGEDGVKCSLCGERSALTTAPKSGRRAEHVDTLTDQARQFWANKELDPEESGAERLCAVCATKRFLVKADKNVNGFNALWADDEDRKQIDIEKEARVPFPSTAAICAQGYLAKLCRTSHPEIIQSIEKVVKAHRALGGTRTLFPRSLRQLAEVYHTLPEDDPQWEMLMREPQETLYPDAIEARMQRQQKTDSEKESYLETVRDLLDKAKDILELSPPCSRLAVIKVDGDSLSKLLTGEPGRLHARWQDVIHPELVEKLRAGEMKDASEYETVLLAERMMGPSLHAFVTRALGEFAHRIAPWVVEQEFNGRLIYTGGDDLLAMAPVDEALNIVARLNQLYSAHWVVDTDPQCDAWAWRRMTASVEALNCFGARNRFQIPLPPHGEKRLQLPTHWVAPHPASNDAKKGKDRSDAPTPVTGTLIPMLGGGQSLSAGIVYAHFKDHLGRLVTEAERLVNKEAKDRMGLGAVALSWRSRGGEKRCFAMKWRGEKPPKNNDDDSVETSEVPVQSWARIVEAFKKEKLSKSLPYKLRERSLVAYLIAGQEKSGSLPSRDVLCNLAEKYAPGKREDENSLLNHVVTLWRAGFQKIEPTATAVQAGCAADGLAICRALANEIPKEEEP